MNALRGAEWALISHKRVIKRAKERTDRPPSSPVIFTKQANC